MILLITSWVITQNIDIDFIDCCLALILSLQVLSHIISVIFHCSVPRVAPCSTAMCIAVMPVMVGGLGGLGGHRATQLSGKEECYEIQSKWIND